VGHLKGNNMPAPSDIKSTPPALTVLYDGACPLCSREIAWYRRRRTAEHICWVDLSRCADADLPPGVDRRAALDRFHVLDADGATVTGAAAFARLWASYPGLRGVAWFARLQGVAQVLEMGYKVFLRLRPRITAWISPTSPVRPERTEK